MPPAGDDGGELGLYRGLMASSARLFVWLSALVIGIFQVAGSIGAAGEQTDRLPLDAVAFALLIAGPAALAFRDRWPLVAVAVAVAATSIYVWYGYPYGPIFVSLVVAIFSAIQAGRSRATWTVAAVGYLAFLALANLAPRPQTETGAHLIWVAGWLVVVHTVSEIVRIRREQAAERRRSAVEERERRAGEQRLHLAQELHDVLAHHISLINVQASVALHLLDDDPAQARPALTAIKGASRESLAELRSALDLLRQGEGAPRAPSPRLSELDSLVEGVRAGGLDVRFDFDSSMPPLPAAVELAAYRIVQEALTNATRHARASVVSVSVGYDDGVTIEVIDDGIGGAPAEGSGISGMRRRAEALGGHFEAGPAPGAGFRVAAMVPVGPS